MEFLKVATVVPMPEHWAVEQPHHRHPHAGLEEQQQAGHTRSTALGSISDYIPTETERKP